MEKDKNAFIKILIVLVIASLALLAIVYVMMMADQSRDQDFNNVSNIGQTETDTNGFVGGTEDPSLLEEMSLTEKPLFAQIENYEWSENPEGILPVDYCDTDNSFKSLAEQVKENGSWKYYYNEFEFYAVENYDNWTDANVEEMMNNDLCGISYSYYGSIENGKYLIWGASCAGSGVKLMEGQLGYEEQQSCFQAEEEVNKYFKKN